MIWLKKILSNFTPKKHLTNLNSGETFEEKFNEVGVFIYKDDGFIISYEDFTRTICWNVIKKISVYKVDLFTIDRIDMEIQYAGKIFSISEDLQGWYQFVLKLKQIFPTIPTDWEQEIMYSPFVLNYRIIFEKEIFEKT